MIHHRGDTFVDDDEGTVGDVIGELERNQLIHARAQPASRSFSSRFSASGLALPCVAFIA